MCALFRGWGGGGVQKGRFPEHTRKGCQCSRKGLLLRQKYAGLRRGRIKRPFNKISLICNTDPFVPNRIHLAETEIDTHLKCDVRTLRRHPGQSPWLKTSAGRNKFLQMVTVVPPINSLCFMELIPVLISSSSLLTLRQEPAASPDQTTALPVPWTTIQAEFIEKSLTLGSRAGF